MTYVDMFGTERHSKHCTCDKCVLPCEHDWVNNNGPHKCTLSKPHNGYHRCQCGAGQRVKHEEDARYAG